MQIAVNQRNPEMKLEAEHFNHAIHWRTLFPMSYSRDEKASEEDWHKSWGQCLLDTIKHEGPDITSNPGIP